jgi:hypothetical protein
MNGGTGLSALHRRTHPEYQAGCFACKIASLHLSPGLAESNEKDTTLRRNLDAYRRLRRDGLQPRRTKDAARLEATASEDVEIEQPHIAQIVGARAAKDILRGESA